MQKTIKVKTVASKFKCMSVITAKTSQGLEIRLTLFQDGSVLIHQCSNVIIYDADVESTDSQMGESGSYKVFNFKQD